MIKNLLKDRIKDAININTSFGKYLQDNYPNINNVEDVIIKDLEDFLLSKEDVYNFSNFKKLFYESIIDFKSHRFANFLRNILTNHPDKNRTYQHILNDIEGRLEETYNIPNSYLKMKRSDLDLLCDELIIKEDYFSLINVRKFIKDNFKVYDYKSYIKENKDLAIKILKTLDADETDKTYIRLRKLLENNMGYLGLFTYFNKIEKIPFVSLQRLYKRIIGNNDILYLLPEPVVNYMRHKLPFKSSDGRTYTKHYERLTDDLTTIEELHQAKLFADQYPLKLRKNILDNSDFIEVIKDLSDNSPEAREKLEMYNKFFLKKVSRYKTQKELIDSLISFVYSMNDDENFRERVKNNAWANMVFDDGDLLVVRVRDIEPLQKIASDTSWCIKDSLSYWTDYVDDNAIQLVIIDLKEPKTSLFRKIGVTLNKDSWNSYSFRTAHLKNDNYISESDLNKRLEKYQITLSDLFQIAIGFGSNQYYDRNEVIEDEYRR